MLILGLVAYPPESRDHLFFFRFQFEIHIMNDNAESALQSHLPTREGKRRNTRREEMKIIIEVETSERASQAFKIN